MQAQPNILHWRTVQRAREFLRQGYTLDQVAELLNVQAADVDLSLWRQMGRGFR
jgi:hypothetical protein